MKRITDKKNGWTLAELLIAVSIVAILAMLTMLGYRVQVARGYDAKRKNDLSIIRTAFEEYYNDSGCYPSLGVLDDCLGPGLAPYIPKIPCDPQTNKPYTYIPEGDACLGYRACASLKDFEDPDIVALGCDPIAGCGWGEGINYCISSGVSVIAPGFVPPALPSGPPLPSPSSTPASTPTPTLGGTPTSTPTTTPTQAPTSTPTPTVAATSTPTPTIPGRSGSSPTPTPGPGGSYFACGPNNQGCNIYSNPSGSGCPVYWAVSCPVNVCSDPINWCAD